MSTHDSSIHQNNPDFDWLYAADEERISLTTAEMVADAMPVDRLDWPDARAEEPEGVEVVFLDSSKLVDLLIERGCADKVEEREVLDSRRFPSLDQAVEFLERSGLATFDVVAADGSLLFWS